MLKFTDKFAILEVPDTVDAGSFYEFVYEWDETIGLSVGKEISRRLKLEISYRKFHRKICKQRSKRIKSRKQP